MFPEKPIMSADMLIKCVELIQKGNKYIKEYY